MALANKLKETFLIFDRNGTGKLDNGSVITALQSIGFVLYNDTQDKIDAMDLNTFIKFGENLAKDKTPENCTQEIITNLTATKKNITVKDLQHVSAAIGSINSKDLNSFLAVVNPTGADNINPANLVAQLTN